MRSLEQRWATADQDLFITATISNPFLARSKVCFAPHIPAWHSNGLFSTIRRVAYRIQPDVQASELHEEGLDYKHSRIAYSDEALAIAEHIVIAEKRKIPPNPMDLWINVEPFGCLPTLATHLLQVVPNSAAVEWVFSVWGTLDSIKGNRRHYQTTADIARVRADIISTQHTLRS